MSTSQINDPLYAKQWHLKTLGGNIEKLWADYDGTGVHTAVYDNGIDKNHEDLKGAYDASGELVINGVTADPGLGNGFHGTAVAGLIAGQANGLGGVGVSHGVTLTGVNVFTGVASGANMVEAVRQMAKFDTVNNSWGWGSTKYVDNASKEGSFGDLFLDALESAAATGRDGRGTVIVNAAGNAWQGSHQDTNTAAFNQSRHTITVGAVGKDGDAASYSNRGASLLVSASSSEAKLYLTTTDYTGRSGYDSSNYNSGFGGTSGAAPIVTGVANLMLDANGLLGWRDVQNILAITADHTGSASFGGGAAGRMGFGWTVNAADNVDGGGMHFSNDVGYGRVDTFEAVRYAEVWSKFGASQTSANEGHVSTGGAKALKLSGTTQFTFNVDEALALEHVDLTLTLTHKNVADLRVELISPEGTVTRLQDAGGAGFEAKDWTWTFGSEALHGELSKGTWTVRVTDTNGGSAGEIKGFGFDGYGSKPSADDVYHFTSDFAKALAVDASRGTIADTDGGTDWLNAAGLVASTTIDLRVGARSDLGGGAVFSVGRSVIENVVTGDGHDKLYGGAGANVLMGMRGNDQLYGLDSDDTLRGGDGDDVLVGGLGDDFLVGGAGKDVYVIGAAGFGHDTIDGFEIGMDKLDFRGSGLSLTDYTITWLENESALTLVSSKDGSTISFRNLTTELAAADFLWGANSAFVDLREPDETGSTGGSTDETSGGTSGDNGSTPGGGGTTGGTTGSDGTDGTGGTVDTGTGAGTGTGTAKPGVKNRVSSVDYVLDANDLNLTLSGTASRGEGNTLGNKLVGNDFDNVLIGQAGSDYLYGGGRDDILRAGAGNDKLDGEEGDDVLEGSDGSDTLEGGTGADVTRGGAGADKYVIDDLGDVVDEVFGQATDDGAIDSVTASVDVTLGRLIENLTLTGAAKVGIGNDLANMITGNGVDNRLEGGVGNDKLLGGAGEDTLRGGSDNDKLDGDEGDDVLEGGDGSDTLEGGTGADVMRGGDGADKYVVDNLGDFVDEVFGQETDDSAVDSVTASVDVTLGRFVENLALTGAAKVGIGNALNNKIVGSDADNRLDGGAGNDTLVGKGGRDVLTGDAGKDVLTGGANADVFLFNEAAVTSVDKITDFSAVDGDKIGISASGFGLTVGDGLDTSGQLAADWFELGTAATRGHAEFFFNAANKTLYWDADGKAGSAIAVGTFTTAVDLSHHSFLLA